MGLLAFSINITIDGCVDHVFASFVGFVGMRVFRRHCN